MRDTTTIGVWRLLHRHARAQRAGGESTQYGIG